MAGGAVRESALMTLTIASIHIYPVKSASGITLESCHVDAFGPRHDRRWMVTDESGVFLSQRGEPRLALVRTAITEEILELSAPGMPLLSVPIGESPLARTSVKVWKDQVSAEHCGDQASEWLSSFLGRPAMLVRMPDDTVRQVDRRYASEGERTAFSDGFPFLLIGQASLDDLNRRLAMPLPMNRFRPNLVIAGGAPFEEDEWSRIALGDIELRVAKPCARCVVTTTNQETAERGVEPLPTLATFRREGGKVLFGQNLIHEATGELRVGTTVTVISRRSGS